MKKLLLTTISLVFLGTVALSQTTHVVSASGISFSPAEITITKGDKIDFQIPGHNAHQVTEADYNAGHKSNPIDGGWSTPTNGGEITFSTSGTFFYVCTFHHGMKGKIIVQEATGVQGAASVVSLMEVSPNPANNNSVLKLTLTNTASFEVSVTNNQGMSVMTVAKNLYAPGEHRINLNAGNLTTGTYFISVRFDDGTVVTRKMMVE
ncbi:MAG: T9SS type A sorting domain-containing protein [Cytophagaceae bacterium]